MKYRNILIVLLVLSHTFSFAQTPIKIEQVESNKQVKFFYNVAEDYIWRVDIPFEFNVISSKSDSLWISDTFNYIIPEFSHTKTYEGWTPTRLYIKIGGEYLVQYRSKNYHYTFDSDTCRYLAIPLYEIEKDNDLQDSLRHYTKIMQNDSIKSLEVGTLSEFKRKHPKVVERMLKSDSIRFTVRQHYEYIDYIAIPIKY